MKEGEGEIRKKAEKGRRRTHREPSVAREAPVPLGDARGTCNRMGGKTTKSRITGTGKKLGYADNLGGGGEDDSSPRKTKCAATRGMRKGGCGWL